MNRHLTVAPDTWALDQVFSLLKVLSDPKEAQKLLEDIQEAAQAVKGDSDLLAAERQAFEYSRQKLVDSEVAVKNREAAIDQSQKVLEANIARFNDERSRFQAEFDRITKLEQDLKETYASKMDELLKQKLDANETGKYLVDLKQSLEAKEKIINDKLAKLKELL